MLRDYLSYQETDLASFKNNVLVLPQVEGINALLLFKKGTLKDAIALNNGKIVHLNTDKITKMFAFNILQSSFSLNKKLQKLAGEKAIAVEVTLGARASSKLSLKEITESVFQKRNATDLQVYVYDIYHYKNKELLPLLPKRCSYAEIAALSMFYLSLAGFSGQKFILPIKEFKKQAKNCLTVLQRAYPNMAITGLLVTEDATDCLKFLYRKINV